MQKGRSPNTAEVRGERLTADQRVKDVTLMGKSTGTIRTGRQVAGETLGYIHNFSRNLKLFGQS